MKPFSLEEALAGEPVKLRDGSKAYVKYVMPDDYKGAHPLRGIYCCAISDTNYADAIWTKEGNSFHSRTVGDLDIISMWEEPRPRVQLDLPAPLKSLEGLNEVYCPILDEDSIGCVFSRVLIFGKNIFQDIRVQGQLDHGNLFATKEDAKEWLDAGRNARR